MSGRGGVASATASTWPARSTYTRTAGRSGGVITTLVAMSSSSWFSAGAVSNQGLTRSRNRAGSASVTTCMPTPLRRCAHFAGDAGARLHAHANAHRSAGLHVGRGPDASQRMGPRVPHDLRKLGPYLPHHLHVPHQAPAERDLRVQE